VPGEVVFTKEYVASVLRAATVLLGVVLLASCGSDEDAPRPPPIADGWGDLLKKDREASREVQVQELEDCPRSDPAPDFRTFDLGDKFENLPQRYKPGRKCEPVDPTLAEVDPSVDARHHRENELSVLYGLCPKAPCETPLSVQTWPVCERTPASYQTAPGGPPLKHEKLRIRGAPAADYLDQERIEIYTGDSTVVVFGKPDVARRAAQKIESQDGDIGPDDPLPPPRAGALTGRIRCEYGKQ
jgi:hypothetical protein